MSKNLVIVESPTKARTLTQFLGNDYEIVASMGHVRDLPKGEFGVDVDHNFEPKYVIPKNKMKMVNQLVKSTEGAKNLYLATDPDREGEAIAWNLLRVIEQKSKAKFGGQKYQRVVFHEITKDAVMDAFSHPRDIDRNLVEAQQARRVLDRLVGYKLSPLLWKKVKSKLSAGRVQSVALRLVVEREREIEAFKSDEYWVIEVEVSRQLPETRDQVFVATLQKVGTAKADIKNKQQADAVVGDLENAKYSISAVSTKDAKKYPNPPFTTSTLQQTAANRLGFVPKRTMSVAQSLYEQGFITYMRTDSVNLSAQAVKATRKFIEDAYGRKYLPIKERHYKASSKLAQEAHEAIRPTNVQVTSDKLPAVSEDMRKLYDLIWKRMVVCQMAEAIVAETAVDILATTGPVTSFPPVHGESVQGEPASARSSSQSIVDQDTQVDLRADGNPSTGATRKKYLLRANGQQVKFDGWYRVYGKLPIKEQILPTVTAGDDLDKRKVDPQQKFTEPPPRYTEATLIRDLEKNGIGRPSTYAPTISTLYDRLYIEKMEGKKIAPTPIGKTTVDFLMKYFSDIFDYSFTAEMEDDLDSIAQGEKEMPATMEKFWGPFEKKVEKVTEEADKMKVEVETTDEVCEKCGKPMVVRYGRFGKFLACSGFPDCKNTKALNSDTGMKCPDCKDGDVVTRKTKRGKTFWGCSNWPKCKFASWTKPHLKVEKAPNEEKTPEEAEDPEESASDK